jgi:hypothetical protein
LLVRVLVPPRTKLARATMREVFREITADFPNADIPNDWIKGSKPTSK